MITCEKLLERYFMPYIQWLSYHLFSIEISKKNFCLCFIEMSIWKTKSEVIEYIERFSNFLLLYLQEKYCFQKLRWKNLPPSLSFFVLLFAISVEMTDSNYGTIVNKTLK